MNTINTFDQQLCGYFVAEAQFRGMVKITPFTTGLYYSIIESIPLDLAGETYTVSFDLSTFYNGLFPKKHVLALLQDLEKIGVLKLLSHDDDHAQLEVVLYYNTLTFDFH